MPPKKVTNLDPMAPRSRRSLLGYEESDEARAERAEAKVRELERENAELRERNGKLEGKVEVLQDDRERLFRIVEARPKQ